MPGPGRDLKLTPALQKAICDSLAAGVDRRHSCLRAGVADRTFRRWMRAGREGKEDLFVSFLSAVMKAEADAVARNVALIQTAAQNGKWQAAVWWLERRHPDLYSSDRKRLRELERLLADVIRERSGGAGTVARNGKTRG